MLGSEIRERTTKRHRTTLHLVVLLFCNKQHNFCARRHHHRRQNMTEHFRFELKVQILVQLQ